MLVNALVEGQLDEAVARRLISVAGHEFAVCYGKQGISYVRHKIGGFSQAAMSTPIFVLVDFRDTGLSCPPEIATAWLSGGSRNTVLRVAVRAVESWLIADRINIANFLRVPVARISASPEHVENPKQELVNAARRSRSASIRAHLAPPRNSTARVGPLYNSELIRFVRNIWNINEARRSAASLDRCLIRLEKL